MSDQEVLTKCIELAIEGGWRGDLLGIKLESQDDGLVRVYWDGVEWSIKDVIYNHEFAKALWGEEIMYGVAFEPDPNGETKDYGDMWQFHLQQMVIAPDPIDYLRTWLTNRS